MRVREAVLPVLEPELGPGVAEALARTAEQLREDSAALDEIAEETIEEIVEHAEAGISVSASRRSQRTRPRCGSASSASSSRREFGVTLTRSQTLEVARLVTDWHGQGSVEPAGH